MQAARLVVAICYAATKDVQKRKTLLPMLKVNKRRGFLKIYIYLILCVFVYVPECNYVYHMHAVPEEVRRGLLELE